MTEDINSIQDVNRSYYNKLYKRKNPAISILHSLISFDQQSKSKINHKTLKEFLKEKYNNNLVILDYGFGHGSLLLKYRTNHILYGCDISEEAVYNFPQAAKLAGKTIHTATDKFFFDKYRDIKYDIISLSHIIEHVENDINLVNLLAAKLSKHGVMLINVPINEVWQDPKHVRKYTTSYLQSIIEKCNLKVIFSFETDKLTSLFLTMEKVKNTGTIGKLTIKAARAIFAILPLAFIHWFEKIFLKNHRNQQLIVLASKDE